LPPPTHAAPCVGEQAPEIPLYRKDEPQLDITRLFGVCALGDDVPNALRRTLEFCEHAFEAGSQGLVNLVTCLFVSVPQGICPVLRFTDCTFIAGFCTQYRAQAVISRIHLVVAAARILP
jgi:hypothetical protein